MTCTVKHMKTPERIGSLLASALLLWQVTQFAAHSPEPLQAAASHGRERFVAAKPQTNPNPRIAQAEPNRWLKLHEQSPSDELRFHRQEHGGSCMDTRRGRIVLFGSNTHGKDWSNSPLLFDLAECRWSRLYPDDDKSTYRVNAEGLPVAGVKGDHPWAMHTFGSVVYDPERDEMVVCSYPAHLAPGRFTNALKHVWSRVKRHPTWTFSFTRNEWRSLPCQAVHFFPYAAVWDSDRKVIVGYGDGVWELGGEPRTWKKVFAKALCGWHNNAVYDSKHKAVLVFGSNENSNDLIVYRAETREHRKMPTPGLRPPKDQHTPMCFDPSTGRTVVLVDRLSGDGSTDAGTTETWLYDLATDSWQQLRKAKLSFTCGMNYNFHYDPANKACLLVADVPSGSSRNVTVFALNIDLAGVSAQSASGVRIQEPGGGMMGRQDAGMLER